MAKTKELGLELQTAGQQSGAYVDNANNNSRLIDDHDHSAGKGKQINASSLNYDSNLDTNSQKVTNTRGVVFRDETAPSNRQIYSKPDGDFYYKNAAGVEVRMTQGSSVVGGAAQVGGGGIGGNYSNTNASLEYKTLGTVYEFFSNGTSRALAGLKSLFLSLKGSANANEVRVEAASNTESYALTLPQAKPTSTRPLFMNSSGAMSSGLIGTEHVSTIAASKITGEISSGNLPSSSNPVAPFGRSAGDTESGTQTFSVDESTGRIVYERVPRSAGVKMVSVNLVATSNATVRSFDDDRDNIYAHAPFSISSSNVQENKTLLWYLWRASRSNPSAGGGVDVLASGIFHRLIRTDYRGNFDDAASSTNFIGNMSASVFDNASSGYYGVSLLAPTRTNLSVRLNNGWQIKLNVFYNNTSDYRS